MILAWLEYLYFGHIIQYLPKCDSIFASIFASRSNTLTQTITYWLHLLFFLDTRASVFTSTMNLKVGPRFAEIWKKLMTKKRNKNYKTESTVLKLIFRPIYIFVNLNVLIIKALRLFPDRRLSDRLWTIWIPKLVHYSDPNSGLVSVGEPGMKSKHDSASPCFTDCSMSILSLLNPFTKMSAFRFVFK